MRGERSAREADSLPSRKPDEGLNPRTPGSRPKLKAVTQPTEPPRSPAGGHLKTLWGSPENEVNPTERKVKKWTDPL